METKANTASMMKLTRLLSFFTILIPLLFLPALARAIPILQLYAEGAAYDSETESWVIVIHEGESFRLWAIGNVDGPGGMGDILDVKLAVAYEAGDDLTVTLTPSTTNNYGSVSDYSTPDEPELLQTVEDGSVPKLGDGRDLPNHGEYGDGIWWQEFLLGNFTLTDSTIADFINVFPTSFSPESGQINVYDVLIDGLYHGAVVHFDLYNHVEGKNKILYKFAPFSHDLTAAPEPATMLLLGSGLIGLAAAGRKKFFKKVK